MMNTTYNGQTRKVDNIRQRLRMRGFRCNLVYTRAGSRLNVVPSFASRIQALRFDLFQLEIIFACRTFSKIYLL